MKRSVFHLRSKRTAFVLTFLTVVVLSLAAGSGTVAAAPEAGVDVADTPQEPVQPGDSFTFNVSLTNTGNETGTVTDIRIQDVPDNVSAPSPPPSLSRLDPGETATEQITVSVGDNVSDGDYSLTAYGDVGGDEPATTPVEFTVSSTRPLSVDVVPKEIPVEETTNVTVTVTEADSDTPISNANVTRFETIESTPVNESGSAVLTLTPAETRNITLDITADGYFPTTVNVTVTEGEVDLDRFDQDGDGTIGREDAVTTVIAYNTGTSVGGQSVGRNAAVQAIIAYNTRQQLN